MQNTSYVDSFGPYEELLESCLAEPSISNLKTNTKMSGGRAKRRFIMDCLMSGVDAISVQAERAISPRVADLVYGVLKIMDTVVPEEGIYFLVLDFVDAFFRVPLNPAERHFYVVQYAGRFLQWNRVAQGSTNGPQAFGRLAALVGRLTQSAMDDGRAKLHIHIYEAWPGCRSRHSA